MDIKELSINSIKPYANNPRRNDGAVDAVAASIKEFGFQQPLVIDRNGVIVVGHTRFKAAKKLGYKTVPCVVADDLTEEQINAYRLADNKTNELAEWDGALLSAELGDLLNAGFDMKLTGFELKSEWFDEHKRNDTSTEGESEEYHDFLEKFEQSKTTDDCYTPDIIFNTVVDWCIKEYGIDRQKIVRPFYPGGDYENAVYPAGCVVLDNPPFSILSGIVKFYVERGIKFFLFGPAFTIFSQIVTDNCTVVISGEGIIYENGAVVNTSFVTNMDDPEVYARTAPDLLTLLKEANQKTKAKQTRTMRKYEYPANVVTAARMSYYGKYGCNFVLRKTESKIIKALDSQKKLGDTIYGGGFLLGTKAAAEKAAAEKAAAEKAAAEKWELSEREIQLINEIDERQK